MQTRPHSREYSQTQFEYFSATLFQHAKWSG